MDTNGGLYERFASATGHWPVPDGALYASPSYLIRRRLPGTPAQLVEHDCLGFTSHASWPDWVLSNGSSRQTIRPAGPLTTDNSEALLLAAKQGLGIILTPDWLAGPDVKSSELVEVLPGWHGSTSGGVYAIMPPGRLVPAKTRVFVDEITCAIQAAWSCG